MSVTTSPITSSRPPLHNNSTNSPSNSSPAINQLRHEMLQSTQLCQDIKEEIRKLTENVTQQINNAKDELQQMETKELQIRQQLNNTITTTQSLHIEKQYSQTILQYLTTLMHRNSIVIDSVRFPRPGSCIDKLSQLYNKMCVEKKRKEQQGKSPKEKIRDQQQQQQSSLHSLQRTGSFNTILQSSQSSTQLSLFQNSPKLSFAFSPTTQNSPQLSSALTTALQNQQISNIPIISLTRAHSVELQNPHSINDNIKSHLTDPTHKYKSDSSLSLRSASSAFHSNSPSPNNNNIANTNSSTTTRQLGFVSNSTSPSTTPIAMTVHHNNNSTNNLKSMNLSPLMTSHVPNPSQILQQALHSTSTASSSHSTTILKPQELHVEFCKKSYDELMLIYQRYEEEVHHVIWNEYCASQYYQQQQAEFMKIFLSTRETIQAKLIDLETLQHWLETVVERSKGLNGTHPFHESVSSLFPTTPFSLPSGRTSPSFFTPRSDSPSHSFVTDFSTRPTHCSSELSTATALLSQLQQARITRNQRWLELEKLLTSTEQQSQDARKITPVRQSSSQQTSPQQSLKSVLDTPVFNPSPDFNNIQVVIEQDDDKNNQIVPASVK